jgi:hypothetical protein
MARIPNAADYRNGTTPQSPRTSQRKRRSPYGRQSKGLLAVYALAGLVVVGLVYRALGFWGVMAGLVAIAVIKIYRLTKNG